MSKEQLAQMGILPHATKKGYWCIGYHSQFSFKLTGKEMEATSVLCALWGAAGKYSYDNGRKDIQNEIKFLLNLPVTP